MFVGSRRLKAAAAGLVLWLVVMMGGCSLDPQKGKVKYLESGKRYARAGKYQEASIQFRNAVKLDPRFVEAYYQLAQADLALKQWSAAFAALQRTAELDPERLDVHVDIGRLYLAAEEYRKADDEASFVLGREPANASAFQLRGAAMTARHDFDGALVTYRKLVGLQPRDSASLTNLALVEINLKRFPDAEQHLRKAIDVAPLTVPSYTNLASLYRLQQRLPEAEQVLKDGVERSPDAPTLYVNWADLLYAQKEIEAAEGVLEKLRDRQRNSADVAIAIGEFYSQRGMTRQALAEYGRGLEVAPKNLEIKKRVIDLFLSTGRYDEAAKLNDEVLHQVPKDIVARIARGRILFGQGKRDEAIVELRQQVTEAPDSAGTHYYLAQAYWQNKNLAQAKGEFQEALRIAPQLTPVLNGLAELNLSAGELAVAREYAERSVQQSPMDSAGRLLLGTVLMQQNQPKKAEEQFRIAEQLSPDSAAAHLRLGLVYARARQWAVAEKEDEIALRLNPRSGEALGQLADTWVQRTQPGKAIQRVQQQLVAYPDDFSAHLVLGSLYMGLERYEDAQTEFQRAVALTPESPQGYLQLAHTHQIQGEIDVAIEGYERALKLQPKFAPLRTLVGNLYLEKGDLDKARIQYEQALAIEPNFALAANNLAWVYTQQGTNLDVALSLAQRAKELLPDLDNVSDTLAWVYYKKGNYVGALPLLQDCVGKAPSYAPYRYHLGMTLWAVGEKALARQQLETALRLNLTGEDAQQARHQLAQTN